MMNIDYKQFNMKDILAFFGNYNRGVVTKKGVVDGIKNLKNEEKALEYYGRALEGKERTMGTNHPDTLATVMNIAIVNYYTQNYGKAEKFYQRVLEGREAQLGKDHSET
ncbi:hypothetical protein TrLO_g15153 [Triparma laevis f. longispina]|uniref:Kinesin light chain n=1 Tax=Triparma laevis f. longispina TaxID=1714387 RepID=A0A9W6ZVW9_9STRA|nr:hypothetical protein TrLO_g15153 [Triparma laevis f. longispina]